MKRFMVFALSVLIFGSGCDRGDADRLARVGARVTQKVQGVMPERIPFGGSFGLMVDSPLQARVRERFQSDRYLSPLSIEIIADGNIVTLRGAVPDQVLKTRAMEVAGSTVGVEQVIDEIALAK